ncbi:MAG: hypothetical protein P1U34_05780 [Coxiellaceae bacterium]|nr:hypothetical protein [Coxiellaceae bacterium]
MSRIESKNDTTRFISTESCTQFVQSFHPNFEPFIGALERKITRVTEKTKTKGFSFQELGTISELDHKKLNELRNQHANAQHRLNTSYNEFISLYEAALNEIELNRKDLNTFYEAECTSLRTLVINLRKKLQIHNIEISIHNDINTLNDAIAIINKKLISKTSRNTAKHSSNDINSLYQDMCDIFGKNSMKAEPTKQVDTDYAKKYFPAHHYKRGQTYTSRKGIDIRIVLELNRIEKIKNRTTGLMSKMGLILNKLPSLMQNLENVERLNTSLPALRKAIYNKCHKKETKRAPSYKKRRRYTRSNSPLSERTVSSSSSTEAGHEIKTDTRTEEGLTHPDPSVKFLTDLAEQLFSDQQQWRQQAQYLGSGLFCCANKTPKHVKKLQQLLREQLAQPEDSKLSLTPEKMKERIALASDTELNLILRVCDEIFNDINIAEDGSDNDYQSVFQRRICRKTRSEKTFNFYKDTKAKLDDLAFTIASQRTP